MIRRILPVLAVLLGAAAVPTPDPYLWLEEVHGARALDWVRAENARSLKPLQSDPNYQPFFGQALAIAQANDRIPKPELIGNDVYNLWQDGTHVQGLWRHTTPDDYAQQSPNWRTAIDLDALSHAEHHVWVWEGATCERPKNTRCLISLSEGGEDAITTREFDLRTASFVQGGFVLPHAKQAVDWEGEDSILVGTDWGAGSMTASGYPFIIKRLHRGQALSQAQEVFRGTPDDVSVLISAFVDAQGHRAVVLQRGLDFFRSEFRLVTPGGTTKLNLPEKAELEGLVRGQFIVKLNQAMGALPAGSLVSLDLATPQGTPRLILAPTARQAIEEVGVTAGCIVVTMLDEVRGRALALTAGTDGGWTAHAVALPDNAAVKLVTASDVDDHAYLQVASFLLPDALYRLDAASPGTAPVQVKSLPAQFDASRDVAEQLEATSTDGTKIPYFLVHPKSAKPDGSNPTLLTGYGGFGVSETPSYSGTVGKLWLEHGGSYALANIRGGGEFGPAWHEAGLKTHRQRIYDDFAAVARDMETRRFTSPAHLGIRGRSNGGLLMGVEFEQHPELWDAVIIGVPLLDMLRFEQIAAGASWVGEYGSVGKPEERAFLAGISPYANLKPDGHYPTPYIFTTTSDDRVGPVHARKFAALMEAQGHPFLYYEALEGGHVASANLREAAMEQALEMTYLTSVLMK